MMCPMSSRLRACCPILMLALAFCAYAALPAQAQDATTQERLDRLERDLSMLQRQIYGGAQPGGGSNIAVNTQVRMDRLEQEMRDLTGKVENAANQVEQLRQRLEQVNSDIDVRFGQLGQSPGQGQTSGQGSMPPPAQRPSRHAQAFPPPPPEPRAIDNPPPVNPSPVNPPPPYAADGGTLTPPPLPPPPPDAFARTPPDTPAGPMRLTPSRTNVAAAGGSLRQPGAGALPGGSAFDQYNAAFGLVRQANYPAAEQALRNFVAEHPSHALAGNAQYWLGEVYLKRGRNAEAAAAFAEGYKRYPKGAKAPEQLLGLATALSRESQKQNACVALSQLDHDFPHPGSGVKERSATEKKRLGC